MRILDTSLSAVAEPLIRPFGFKGGYLSELWQAVAWVKGEDHTAIGVGVQSVLWADEGVTRAMSEEEGNHAMLRTAEFALSLLRGREFATPAEGTFSVFGEAYDYAKRITGREDLRPTFVLNALVSVDNALWQLYAKERGEEDLYRLVEEETAKNLSHRQKKLYAIPLIGYQTTAEEIRREAEGGSFLMKIKIGADPSGNGDRDEMLAHDKKRLSEIHQIAKDLTTPYTDSGRYLYYLDANGRYDTRDRLFRLLDHADRIGALERILILEEPFSEENGTPVFDIPLLVAADESAYSPETTHRRIEEGYRALTLKPIAKTVSETLLTLNEAKRMGVHCFCADLTVNPYMVDINKNVAARIAPFPGVKIGIFESNGAQNYKNWEKMKTYHPLWGTKDLSDPENGIFPLCDDFYKTGGGIYRASAYYEEIVRKKT